MTKKGQSGFRVAAGKFLVITFCAALISACGGGGSSQSAGVGGTGISTVQGKATAFGSIYVNGVKFETDDSTFDVDGIPGATQDDLSIGMIVTLRAETQDGNYTGKTFAVSYDDEIQGPVDAIPPPADVPGSNGTQKTFVIFGQTITIDDTVTVFDGTTFVDLAVGDLIEVSGFRTSNTAVTATYVELKTDGEVELRGTIDGYMPPAQQFTLLPSGVSVTFDGMTEIDVDGGVLADGLFVEVEGSLAGATIAATEIEEENEGFDDDLGDVNLQGLVTNFFDLSDFQVNGQLVDASGAELRPANAAALLANGVEVEVRGDIVGGVLFAERLELEDEEARLKAIVASPPAPDGSFDVRFEGLMGTIEIQTDSQTLFDDDGPDKLDSFSVADIEMDDFVSIRGTESGDTILADTVKRLDAMNPDDSELEGRVDAFTPDASITVLGLPFGVSLAETEYQDTDETILSSFDFYNNKLQIGDRVHIRDNVPTNGTANEVELDD